MKPGFIDQVNRNLVALISLVLAIVALSYNTWRNERTEDNRNLRSAGFEIILTVGELQQIVFFSHYDQDLQRGNPRAGWTRVLVLDDLSQIMPDPVEQATDELLSVWESNWSRLGEQDEAETRISEAIDVVRQRTLAALAELD